jgi:hypothetical protein
MSARLVPQQAARRSLLPAGGHSLLERWAMRDLRYARRRPAQALTTHDVLAVREARIREAGSDPVAIRLAAGWVPPDPDR